MSNAKLPTVLEREILYLCTVIGAVWRTAPSKNK